MTKRRVAYIRDKVDGRNNSTKRKKGKAAGNIHKNAAGQTVTAETSSKSHTPIASPAEAAAVEAAGKPLEEQLPLESRSVVVAEEEQEEGEKGDDLSMSPEIVDSLFVADHSNGKAAAAAVAGSDESEATDDDLMIITTTPATDEIASSSSTSLSSSSTSTPAEAADEGEAMVGSGVGGVNPTAGGNEDSGRGGGETSEGGGGDIEARLLEIKSMKVRANRSCCFIQVQLPLHQLYLFTCFVSNEKCGRYTPPCPCVAPAS